MAESIRQVSDELWEAVQPLLPVQEPDPRGGRPRIDDRRCFGAIVFVLFTGIAWRHLPRESGSRPPPPTGVCRSGRRPGCSRGCTACCSRSSTPPARSTGRPRWSTAATFALFKGALTGPSPVDRARPGSKHHLIVDPSGIPPAITLTGGHRNDVTQLLPLVDGIGPVRGKVGRPRQRADSLVADRGYDHDKFRRELWRRGVKPIIARRRTAHGSGLGTRRWVVERTFAWLHFFRRLRLRWERLPRVHEAFMSLGCAIVCWRYLRGV